jgi:uncharacterized protein YjbI with pentapeptide repeats
VTTTTATPPANNCKPGNPFVPNCDFSNQDLTGANFAGANVSLANFSGANLTDADFSGATATGATFFGATLKNATFNRANISQADFRNSKFLYLASLSETIAQQAKFVGADLMSPNPGKIVEWSSSDFSRADFASISIRSFYCGGCNFDDAILTNATIDLAYFGRSPDNRPTTFRRTKLQKAKFMNGAGFTDAIIENSDFSGASFVGNFSMAVIDNSDFTGSMMNSSSFDDATLRNVNFSNANVQFVGFDNASLTDVTFRGGTWENATGRQSAELCRVHPPIGSIINRDC